MPATLIDGKAIAEQINAETVVEIARLKDQYHVTPGLAVILVGENPASVSYVSMKDKMCARLGMHSERINLPRSTPESELLAKINTLNLKRRFTASWSNPHYRRRFRRKGFLQPSVRPKMSTAFTL